MKKKQAEQLERDLRKLNKCGCKICYSKSVKLETALWKREKKRDLERMRADEARRRSRERRRRPA